MPSRADQTRSKRPDRRVARTKQAILDALTRLTEHEDYRKITVTALAREADIDRKTFYLHYGSVDEVIEEAVREKAEMLARQLKSIPLFKDGSINVTELYAALGPALLPEIMPTKGAARHLPADLLLESAQKELVRLILEDDRIGIKELGPLLEFCVTYIVGGAFSVYRRWLLSDSEVPLEEVSTMATKLAFNGVAGLLEDGVPAVGQLEGGGMTGSAKTA